MHAASLRKAVMTLRLDAELLLSLVHAMLLRCLKLQSRADKPAGEHPYRRTLSRIRQTLDPGEPLEAREEKGDRGLRPRPRFQETLAVQTKHGTHSGV